ncbi:CLUMA_CG000421, isoform A [Clunio marinus]|uniref:CLUMA_CG000421, isoform A n=1 Tax=Clunio marinus TaxID=568069 RepID=A0A1J1HJN8_9DIPT|nr:CLUMA_CG000421, isoform A [Clunio marinus]
MKSSLRFLSNLNLIIDNWCTLGMNNKSYGLIPKIIPSISEQGDGVWKAHALVLPSGQYKKT